MQDWAGSVSRQVWSKPLRSQFSTTDLADQLNEGGEEVETSCWGCFPKKSKSPRYSKMKEF